MFSYNFLLTSLLNIILVKFENIICFFINISEKFILYFFNYGIISIYFIKNIVIVILSLIIPLILAIAFLTLMERKIIGSMQLRLGPNYVGIFGLIQPVVDGVKLLLKETIIPYRAEKFLFLFAPYFLFLLSLISWLIIPLNNMVVISDLNLVYYSF